MTGRTDGCLGQRLYFCTKGEGREGKDAVVETQAIRRYSS